MQRNHHPHRSRNRWPTPKIKTTPGCCTHLEFEPGAEIETKLIRHHTPMQYSNPKPNHRTIRNQNRHKQLGMQHCSPVAPAICCNCNPNIKADKQLKSEPQRNRARKPNPILTHCRARAYQTGSQARSPGHRAHTRAVTHKLFLPCDRGTAGAG